MKIAVIETGTPAQNLRSSFGGYTDMFRQAFSEIDAGFELINYPVFDGASPPASEGYDGYLITGSPFGVYEDHAFIAPLKEQVRALLAAGKRVAGICFGHQLMAEAVGGEVEKSDKGWGVGVHTYELEASLKGDRAGDGGVTSLSCLVSHQDQVIAVPDNVTRLGGSAFCPFGILSYGQGNGLSFQMHPEFTVPFATSLLESRKDRIADTTYLLAEQSFSQHTDRLIMLEMLRDFFKQSGKHVALETGQAALKEERHYV